MEYFPTWFKLVDALFDPVFHLPFFLFVCVFVVGCGLGSQQDEGGEVEEIEMEVEEAAMEEHPEREPVRFSKEKDIGSWGRSSLPV